ncbi:MAG: hypothetical protein V7721_03605 [Porticoccaceae bacterium]
METESLIGRVLDSVLVYPCGPVHPAWADDSTPSINSWKVFLTFSDGTVCNIEPCEVELSEERYPSLGLRIEEYRNESTDSVQSDGSVIKTVSVKEANELLPQVVTRVQESDPLEEGAISQYTFTIGNSASIVIRHIMPPMTLGVLVSNAG